MDGSTSLTRVGNQFYLYNSSGTGPTLKYAGSDFVAGQFGGWTPIGAVQTANGYDVAWKVTGADQYTVWSTDTNGNYITNLTGNPVSGTDASLEALETTFHQDLNGDGVIGLIATVIQVDGSTSLTGVGESILSLQQQRDRPRAEICRLRLCGGGVRRLDAYRRGADRKRI